MRKLSILDRLQRIKSLLEDLHANEADNSVALALRDITIIIKIWKTVVLLRPDWAWRIK